MTRTTHHAHPTPAFPVFCMAFTDDETLLLGGGGGASRTGIVNKLKLYAVDRKGEKFEGIKEHVFEKGADSPNTLAVDPSRKHVIVGVNEPESSIQASFAAGNKHCRVLDFAGEQFEQVNAIQTIDEPWSDNYPYQKQTVLNATNSLLAISATNYDGTFSAVTVLTYPDLQVIEKDVVRNKGGSGGEVVDLDWSADGAWFAITTPKGIDLYSVSLPKSTELSDEKNSNSPTDITPSITFRQTILPPNLDLNPVVFRSARFARTNPYLTPDAQPPLTLHCILNTKPQPKTRSRTASGKAKRSPSSEKAFACNLSLVRPKHPPPADAAQPGEKVAEPKSSGDQAVGHELGKWDVCARRDVGNRPVTALQVSADGKLLAYASSDLSIGILDARTLTPLLKILHAHSFPTTALAFNPSGTLLASSSADNTVRLIVVPESFGSSTMMILSLIIALLLVLIALYMQYKV